MGQCKYEYVNYSSFQHLANMFAIFVLIRWFTTWLSKQNVGLFCSFSVRILLYWNRLCFRF